MTRTRRQNKKKKHQPSEKDQIALQFYNEVLRNDPILRQQCEDRHVFDATVASWKQQQQQQHDDGKARFKGMSPSKFIFCLKTKWKLIDVKIAEENVIVWSARTAVKTPTASSSEAETTRVDVGSSNKADRVAQTIERIRNSRTEMECNRNGISIDPIVFGNNNQQQQGIVQIGQLATQTVNIYNSSNFDMVCKIQDRLASQRGFLISGIIANNKEFVLSAQSSTSITVSFTPRMFGIEKSIVVFEFTSVDDNGNDDDDDEYDYCNGEDSSSMDGTNHNDEKDNTNVKKFTITRYITVRAGDPDDYEIIKPTAPYVKKKLKSRGEDYDKFANPTKAPSVSSSSSSGEKKKRMFQNKLGKYPIPNNITNMGMEERDVVMDSLYRGAVAGGGKIGENLHSSFLTMENYSTCMHYLLWFEEMQMNTDIKSYDMEDAPIDRFGPRCYKLKVPGLAENRPSVLKGDRIIVNVKGGGKFEGVVQRTESEHVIIEFHPSFHRNYVNGLRVDVRFTFSRTTLRASHQALSAVKESFKDGRNDDDDIRFDQILFPSTDSIWGNLPWNCRVAQTSQLAFFNRSLNQEQQSAVLGILQSVARPAPYLIYGPPGTGKTSTLVESILQTMFAAGSDRNAKILICAPSNTATDVVVERLAEHVSPREMIRVMAYSRERKTVPESVMGYTNYDEETDSFQMPDVNDLKNYKIVAVTVSTGGKLYNNGIQDHFTHAFLDEAGHSIEPETIGCLASVMRHSRRNPPVIVLAGDPQQLGPIIRSDIGKKFGLEKSLLERVSEFECYRRREECDDLGYHYDKRMMTKLVQNYRSHPSILQLPNQAFYNGDLIAAADITRSHRFVKWEHLPRQKFPILFHGCKGDDMREASSPSWFNPEEAQCVKMYVDLLVKETRQNQCKPEDIGIITPYHRQAQKIRKLLKEHNYDCKVGSVEEFQGSERPVIIISTVRSTVDYIELDLKHKLGFLSNKKRFNVAVTRAQALLIVIGNPFTLENDPNWKSMIDFCVDGGGYTGVDYVKMEERNESGAAVEEIVEGMQAVALDQEEASDEDDFLLVSHVTAQEGPAWRSEE